MNVRVSGILVVAASLLAALLTSGATNHGRSINNDTAQHLGVARNLLNDSGYSTNAVYYEEQLRYGKVPAPQTVWPPGFPALIAMLGSAGVELEVAAHAILIVAYALNPILLFFIARLAGISALSSAVASLLLIAFFPVAYGVLWYETEVLFICLTLVSLMALQRSGLPGSGRIAWLLIAGIFGAGAVLVKYMGICWIAALGIAALWRILKSKNVASLGEGFLTVFPGAATVVVLFVRNLRLTGDYSGGAILRLEASAEDLGRAAIAQLRAMFGIPGDGVISDLAVVFIIILAVTVAIDLGYRIFRSLCGKDDAVATWEIISGGFVCTSIALILYMAWQRHPDLIAFRYFVPVVPFALLLVTSQTIRLLQFLRERLRTLVKLAVSCVIALGLLGQAVAATQWLERYQRSDRSRIVADSLSMDIDGHTLRDWLENEVGASETILAPDAQLLGFMIQRPTVSLPAPYYTNRIWTHEEVRKLICRFSTKAVIFTPICSIRMARTIRIAYFSRRFFRNRVYHPGWM